MICDGSKRQEAWSPQSCTTGPNGGKQLTDFAMEAILPSRRLEKVSLTFETATSHYWSIQNPDAKDKGGRRRGGSRGRREDAESKDLDSEVVPLTDSCELLEGLYFRMPSPDDSDGDELETPPTSSPTRPREGRGPVSETGTPTSSPTRPREERGPVSDTGAPTSSPTRPREPVSETGAPTSSPTRLREPELETGAPTSRPTRPRKERGPEEGIPAARQCDAKVDVPNGFDIGKRKQKIRSCRWVKRRRHIRCPLYDNCCPCTCHPSGFCPAGR